DSVLGQTLAPAEVLVVDDASTDDTAAIAASYADRGVRYLRIDARHVHLARRAGYRATSADILLFLDADNTLDPTYLERGLPLFAGDRRIAIVYPDLQAFGDESGLHVTPDWDPVRLARGPNFADAGALVTRQSLLISGALE